MVDPYDRHIDAVRIQALHSGRKVAKVTHDKVDLLQLRLRDDLNFARYLRFRYRRFMDTESRWRLRRKDPCWGNTKHTIVSADEFPVHLASTVHQQSLPARSDCT